MFVSVFDLFKVGVGPSSSHTMGPTLAAGRFLSKIKALGDWEKSTSLEVTLYGSLAHTGVGHGTIKAVMAGLLGFLPDHDPKVLDRAIDGLQKSKMLEHGEGQKISFDPENSIVTDKTTRQVRHPNALSFSLDDDAGVCLCRETYYSVGGGFVLDEVQMDAEGEKKTTPVSIPYPFHSADEMLKMGEKSGLGIAEMKRANERVFHDEQEIERRLATIWSAMDNCISRGVKAGGQLPGGLGVKRRARALFEALEQKSGRNDIPLHSAIDWLSAYAMAVNEENAAGGKVVTAPTNGAAGVLPAVIRYYLDRMPGAEKRKIPDMLLTAAAIGGLIKYNASISGAEVGCQGEVGSASAMAAGALAMVMGASNAQIENATEIALEHHLGMTCDPVAGLVQIPCIERNGMGAVKAVAAASLAMHGDGSHKVTLDQCIETMRITGRDMDERYKETSLGGLSVSVVEC
ncbi:L-serine dehydratase, beta subunit / L-serine dehydratase, alpha subunit [hydrothermal vent metagenome]|uniref:L-serine dehydratase, beta subunit / L-serine dehydratase, alpha subunit n=1 Tax=hydrothermal vent metagenome TaxID=652676 RepID=A0A3B0TYU0_9ZZZZ